MPKKVAPGHALSWPLLMVGAVLSLLVATAFAQSGAGELPKGLGPVQELSLPADIDADMAAEGEATFTTYCSACHKFGDRYVGPDLLGVTVRHAPEWIMNMILNTDEMIFNDDTAYALLAEYMTPMPQLPLSMEQVRAILEFFRLSDQQHGL